MILPQDRLNLPWTKEAGETQRFGSILAVLMLVFLVLAIWIPSAVVPEKDRKTLEKLPPQLAKLVKKKEPPKPKPKPKPVKKEEPKKVEEKPKPVEKPKPKKKPKPIKKPEPVKKPLTEKVKKAREVAKKSGLLALQSDLADLKSVVDVSALKKKVEPKKQATIAAKASSPSTSEVFKSSEGIKTDTLAAPSQELALKSRESEVLEATEDEISLAVAEEKAASGMLTRDEKGIRLVVESLKSSFNKLYQRELRKDPFLEGLLMLEIVIEPTGEVSFCRVVSSELDHPVLEEKIVKRMYLADFGIENVLQTTINIPFPFRPN